jgi:hypothetical protein
MSILTNLYGPMGLYALWIILHFIAPHLYVYFCTPATFVGFITSPFIAPAPHCSALRWIIFTGGDMISSMWVILAGWFIQILVSKTKNVVVH